MKNTLKPWENALIVGLLIGLLCSPADAAQLPLSRWQAGESEIRYEICLFPFGIAEAEQTAMAQAEPTVKQDYEIKFKVLEWWEGLFAA